jgi:hypothetical protein
MVNFTKGGPVAIDFTTLGSGDSFDTELNPRVLFDLLPDKATSKFKYPRDVQSEVMEQWFPRRTEQNLTVKMNTSGGKTIVALLLLKSSLNEGYGPAVYIAPTPYLAEQVIKEANSVGLEVTDDPKAARYRNGKAILVTYVHRLINGRSVFGVSADGVKIPIGSIVIDDAHACLETAEEQFSLTVVKGHLVYDGLFELFKDDLAQQSLTRLIDVEQEYPGKLMPVPYWAWADRQKEVVKLLSSNSKDKELE